jgi:serine/threonine-protein phosphatase 2B regulatory subunit
MSKEYKVDIDRARMYFEALDLSKKGTITKHSLRHIYAALGQVKPDSLLDIMMSMVDLDNKSGIDYETFRNFFRNPAKFFEKRDAMKAQEVRLKELAAQLPMKTSDGSMGQLDPSKLGLQECLRLTLGKEQIKPADIKKMYRDFQASDVDQSGELDLNEFYDMVGLDKPKAIVKRLFELIDVDGSGSIEIKEFLVGISSLTSSDPTEKLKLAFTLYDEDGSGTIESGEMRKLIVASMAGQGLVNQKEVDEKLLNVYKAREAITGKTNKIGNALPSITFDDFLKIAKSKPGLLISENFVAVKPKLTGRRAEKMAIMHDRGDPEIV